MQKACQFTSCSSSTIGTTHVATSVVSKYLGVPTGRPTMAVHARAGRAVGHGAHAGALRTLHDPLSATLQPTFTTPLALVPAWLPTPSTIATPAHASIYILLRLRGAEPRGAREPCRAMPSVWQ